MEHPCINPWPRLRTFFFKITSLLLGAGLVAFEPIWGQAGLPEIKGARCKGLGDQGVVLQDLEGYMYNSAAMARLKSGSITLHSETRFFGTGIKGMNLNVVFPVRKMGVFGGMIEQYGLPEYKQQHFRAGYARILSEHLVIGASFGLQTYAITGYRPDFSMAVDLGLMYSPVDQFTLAWSSFVPWLNSKDGISTSPIHLIGLHYKASDQVNFYVQFEKENQLNWTLKWGMEFVLMTRFVFRIGTVSDASKLNVGFGYQLNDRIKMDGSFSIHTVLGVTPAFSLRYTLKQQKQPAENL